ncbi:DUF1766-domain-containing protein [Trematosphaeria pertusa]|uniref:DUF1766-domain-containing protein n=1 Tax=Trematosphaeria pertusa TaxID=390896 RepID=A0A6A6HQZ6_9PLEO|nr:DUF1766-domain-containing protein [Trematosphaeria pertusa]KAF2240299.1 DUF1766-domain-containing protein [Trematosphaeria pertusa]
MAFTGRTPESLLPRSDSKNPATTCKGITKSGRPCRRAIDTTLSSRNNGVLAVVSVASDSDEEDTGAAAFFCWQHKDQAEQLAAANAEGPSRQDTRLYPLQERSSIDTLVARLGVLEVEEPAQTAQQKRRQSRQEERRSGKRPPRRVNRPPTWDQVQGPLMSVPSDVMAEKNRIGQRPGARPQRKKPGFWQMLCCGAADDDYVEVVRHKKRVQGQASLPPTTQYASEAPMPQAPHRTYQSRPSDGASPVPPSAPRPPSSSVPSRKPLSEKPARPLNKTASPRPSETSTLLSHIPKSLPPQTTSTLLSELSKPISPHDEEGYIYIFWLTPEALGPAPSSTASTLLAPPSSRRPEQSRRTSDVLRQYSVRRPQRSSQRPPRMKSAEPQSSTSGDDEKNTILLKIGRANNVTRRMNEWTRQCGYSLSLVRWYPYVPSSTQSPSPSPHASPAHSRRPSYQNRNQNQNQRPSDPVRRVSEGVRKVPHAHRVERLVHIELGEQRAMKKCEACGKEHREWFEVEASREGVKRVDEVVRRWVDWAERVNE